MGNNDTTSAPSPASESNDSLSGAQAALGFPEAFHGFFWSFAFSAAAVMNHCHMQTGDKVWFGVKIFILVMSFPANAALMWMLLKRKRAMTASEVLGLNVSVMDILYCLCLPLDIYTCLHEVSKAAHSVHEAVFALNIFGCPLLLTFMCLERYVAVARPVAYLTLGQWKYRVALCACAWILTLTVGLLGYFVGVFTLALPLSIIISLLFLVMLLCLLGIVWVLCQSAPGEASRSSVPLKRRALKNIVAVMVPSAVAYSPLVALVPYMAVITSSQTISSAQCYVLQVLLVFPNIGLFIGPMFYLSRLRQVTCWTPSSKTLAEETTSTSLKLRNIR
uniref:G-protein coupled receptor 35-like n=1 Tax=Scatophagus argus TaxID=75038 RepID=UPI001ED80581|nr:G-protein coupled receptor 35-like [Scatophagus argus]